MLLDNKFRRSTGKKRGRLCHARPLHLYSALLALPQHLHCKLQTQGKRKPLFCQAPCSLKQLLTPGVGCWDGHFNLKLSCQGSSQVRVLHMAQQAALCTWRSPYPIAASSVIRFLWQEMSPQIHSTAASTSELRALAVFEISTPGLALAQLF